MTSSNPSLPLPSPPSTLTHTPPLSSIMSSSPSSPPSPLSRLSSLFPSIPIPQSLSLSPASPLRQSLHSLSNRLSTRIHSLVSHYSSSLQHPVPMYYLLIASISSAALLYAFLKYSNRPKLLPGSSLHSHHSLIITKKIILFLWNECDVEGTGELQPEEVRGIIERFALLIASQQHILQQYCDVIIKLNRRQAVGTTHKPTSFLQFPYDIIRNIGGNNNNNEDKREGKGMDNSSLSPLSSISPPSSSSSPSPSSSSSSSSSYQYDLLRDEVTHRLHSLFTEIHNNILTLFPQILSYLESSMGNSQYPNHHSHHPSQYSSTSSLPSSSFSGNFTPHDMNGNGNGNANERKLFEAKNENNKNLNFSNASLSLNSTSQSLSPSSSTTLSQTSSTILGTSPTLSSSSSSSSTSPFSSISSLPPPSSSSSSSVGLICRNEFISFFCMWVEHKIAQSLQSL